MQTSKDNNRPIEDRQLGEPPPTKNTTKEIKKKNELAERNERDARMKRVTQR